MDYKSAITKNIKKYCELRKITYSELARRANIKLKTLQAILYFDAYKEAKISTLHLLAKALKVKVDDLLK